jgi:phosphopantothenoylcysteine decarboxylase/phosphopantothenate--cysteine ligase
VTIRVVLGVSGGIAAYKSAEIVRALVDGGAEVRVVMTPAATRFLAPLTLSVLSKNPVIADLWDPSSGAVDHVALARWADVLAVAPATADVLAKLARGIGDDVLTTYALGHRKALLVAPAMNTWMWAHPATEENLAILRSRGATVVEPDAGDLACGDVGPGRLAPPARIARATLAEGAVARSLEGRRVLVTAGPTREPVDPVRFISNRSSGKMGYALAREAARRGADVVLVSGPVSLAPPPGARLVRVERASEMRDAVLAEIADADSLLMAAAPADFTVATPADTKMRRAAGVPRIELAPTPDILREASGAARKTAVLVGFAAETQDLLANAAKKLADKGVDLLVGNDVSRPGIGFDADENEVVLLAAGAPPARIERSSKTVVAGRILDRVAELLDIKCPKNRSAHVPSAR